MESTTRSSAGGTPVISYRLPFLLLLALTLTASAPSERSHPSSSSSSSSTALEDVDPNFAPNRRPEREGEGDNHRHHQQQCERPTSSPFRIIVDGGSTGSRLHVFEFVQRPSRGRDPAHDSEALTETETETVVVRRGSAKAWTPLSAYAPSPLDDDGGDDGDAPPPSLDPKHVASHLLPAFEYAASVVPERYHRLTTVRYQATAGMRLLSESDQRLVYDALYEGLRGATLEFEVVDEETGGKGRRRIVPFPFSLRRDDVSTLDGRMEGLYGAVAANYLAGRIDADLHLLMPPRQQQQQRHQRDFRRHSSRGIDAGVPIHEPAQECPNLDADDSAVPKGEGDVDQDGNRHHHHHHHHGPYGALDMGGSSTQLVFHPGDDAEGANASSSGSGREDRCDLSPRPVTGEEEGDDQSKGGSPRPPRTCRARYSDEGGARGGADGSSPPLPKPELERPATPTSAKRHGNRNKRRKLDGNEFFSTSYLSYGVDQFRERLWDLWLADADGIRHQEQGGDDSGGGGEREGPRLDNPCGFPGHQVTWRNATLVGTGDASACADEVRRLLPGRHRHRNGHQDSGGGAAGVVGGVRHPPLRGKFYAMSLYFFTLDCLRVLSHPDDPAARAELDRAWPTPTLRQLGDALDGFCSRSWHGDLIPLLEGGREFHPFTRPSVLPHRCAEAVYMVTLLRDGFGFDPDARDITFAYDVDGSEVEWTLGMALSNRAEEMAMAGAEASDGGGASLAGEEAPSRRRRDMGLFSWMEYLFSPSSSDGDGCGTIGGGEGVGLASAYFLDMFGSYSMDSLSSSATPVPCGSGGNGTSDEGNGLGETTGAGGDGGGERVGLASAYFLDMFGYYSMDRRLETFRPEPGV